MVGGDDFVCPTGVGMNRFSVDDAEKDFAANVEHILLASSEAWVGAIPYLKDTDSFLFYMPTPVRGIPEVVIPTGIQIPITRSLKKPVKLVFGSGNKAGRVFGFGLEISGRKHQMWRMDFHLLHEVMSDDSDPELNWSSEPFHYHVTPFNNNDNE